MTGYELSRAWFDWAFENPDLNSTNHTALYMWIIEKWNRLGQKEKFGLPAFEAMEFLGIKSYKTYKKAFDDLTQWGFVEVVTESKNQYTANIIALVNFTEAHTKASPKQVQSKEGALVNFTEAHTKASPKHFQSTSHIDKPINNKTNKPKTILANDESLARNKTVFSDTLEETTTTAPPVAPPPPDVPDEPNSVAAIRELIMQQWPSTYWNAAHAKAAQQMYKKMEFKIRIKQGSLPEQSKVVSGIRYMITHLPEFWKDKADLLTLNKNFETITNQQTKLNHASNQQNTRTSKITTLKPTGREPKQGVPFGEW